MFEYIQWSSVVYSNISQTMHFQKKNKKTLFYIVQQIQVGYSTGNLESGIPLEI